MFGSRKITELQECLREANRRIKLLEEINNDLQEIENNHYEMISNMPRKERLKYASIEALLSIASNLRVPVDANCDKADIIRDILDVEERVERI